MIAYIFKWYGTEKHLYKMIWNKFRVNILYLKSDGWDKHKRKFLNVWWFGKLLIGNQSYSINKQDGLFVGS